jgi:hypothetical protein
LADDPLTFSIALTQAIAFLGRATWIYAKRVSNRIAPCFLARRAIRVGRLNTYNRSQLPSGNHQSRKALAHQPGPVLGQGPRCHPLRTAWSTRHSVPRSEKMA